MSNIREMITEELKKSIVVSRWSLVKGDKEARKQRIKEIT